MTNHDRVSLQRIVRNSFLNEVNALKPGNVSRYADGHGMSYADFVFSADICTPVLCDDRLGVGERVLRCVELTREKVGCNTNLGMLLLFAPVIRSYETVNKGQNLRDSIRNILNQLNPSDADNIYRGIRLAKPGGLGRVERHDVNYCPDISMLEAMQEAADRDLVARQYVSAYEDAYKLGVNCLGEFDKCWNSVEWATVACHLTFMVNYPDSHIRRKFGDEIARQVQSRAVSVFERFKNKNNPVEAKPALLEFDKELKDANINPGTSADMTAVSLLLYGIAGLT